MLSVDARFHKKLDAVQAPLPLNPDAFFIKAVEIIDTEAEKAEGKVVL